MNVLSPSSASFRAQPQLSRRAALGLAVGAALGSVGVPASLAAAAKPGPKRPGRRRQRRRLRYKVVTRIFRNSYPIVMRSRETAYPYPAPITVSGLRQGEVLDINVTLQGFQHEYPRDADILLVAPNGLGAVILSDVGGSVPVTNLTIVLDDQAPAPPAVLSPLVTGAYQPWNEKDPNEIVDDFPPPAVYSSTVALSTFKGINPNGRWMLYVYDDVTDDEGSLLGGWALTIRARIRV